MSADLVTVLTTRRVLATKALGLVDSVPTVVESYGNAKRCRVERVPVQTLDEMLALRQRLLMASCSFIIRGEPLPDTDLGSCRRLLYADRETGDPATFRPAAPRWLDVDFDSVPAPADLDFRHEPTGTARHLASLIPTGFAGTSCIILATPSAGVKPGIRARLTFMLDRPTSDAECIRWLRGSPVDLSLYRPVQAHYTAAPVLRGVADPMPWRLQLAPGERDRVQVPDLPEPVRIVPPLRVTGRSGSGYARAALVSECEAVTRAGVGDRHGSLNRAAFKLARFVRTGELGAGEVASNLMWAARAAGIDDPDEELRRFLRCGLRAGAERAGVA